jgi:hypothetical protein
LVDVRENLTQQVNLFKETEVIVVKKWELRWEQFFNQWEP